MTVTRTFYAWHRVGFTTALTGTPGPGRARADVSAQVALANSTLAAPIPVELAGPGDVVSLDAAEIRRTEPFDGCPDFETAYLPYLETISADLPWRFSPLGPATTPLADPEHPGPALAQQGVTPWIALVVLPETEATLEPTAGSAPPSLLCDAAALPDPAELWAWAHVQVATVDGQDPRAALGDPAKSLARLVCPVRLAPQTAYRAFLVPTFQAGRRTALPAGTGPLDPAWGTTGSVTLPVYHSFAFTTGPAGTFETLARRLRPRPAPQAVAGILVSTDAPGWGVTGVAGSTTTMQGALRPLAGTGGTDGAETPPDPGLAAALATAISATSTGPQLRPPVYGQDYAGGCTAVSAANTGWLSEVNTDLRRRLAAGLGTWAVAVEQDDLCDLAWQQLATAGVPAQTDRAELADTLTQAITRRQTRPSGDTVGAVLARLTRPGGSLSPRGLAAGVGADSPTSPAAAKAVRAPSATAPGTRFSPVFELAAYELLRAVAPQWLLPGAPDIGDDTVLLLRTNPLFTEAFLVGLNHALARELTWRRYPLAPGGTMLNRFWSAPPDAADAVIRPIGDWGASKLGSHGAPGDQLVLLIRGMLLRRFPTAAVYLAGVQGDGVERHLAPTLTASYSPGTSIFGFPLTPEQALDPVSAAPTDVTAWCVVLQEDAGASRLGCDDATDAATDPALSSWQDLSWGHPHLRDRSHIPVRGPLAGITRPLAGPESLLHAPLATWGADAGQLAAILQRPAFRVRIPVALWLTPTPAS